jgi:hypothetical protein
MTKRRSIDLDSALVRLTEVADLIKLRTKSDPELRELCEEYAQARSVLRKYRSGSKRSPEREKEYSDLISGLEDEIIERLLQKPGN